MADAWATVRPIESLHETHRGEFDHDGRLRSYVTHAPSDRSHARPLVLVLHGGGGNSDSSAQQTGFNVVAEREDFIVVHPDGTGPARPLLNAFGRGRSYTWNAGSCCGHAAQERVDDVGFLLALIARLQQAHAIDPLRIYAAGFSNGGMMCYRLACEARGLLAAIGVVSGVLAVTGPVTAPPTSLMHIHGTADQNVMIAGGVGAKALDRVPKPPVMHGIQHWLRANGLSGSPVLSEQGRLRRQRWQRAEDGIGVELCLVDGGGHAWPGGEQLLPMLDRPVAEIDATRMLWEFFAAHPRRAA